MRIDILCGLQSEVIFVLIIIIIVEILVEIKTELLLTPKCYCSQGDNETWRTAPAVLYGAHVYHEVSNYSHAMTSDLGGLSHTIQILIKNNYVSKGHKSIMRVLDLIES